MRNAAQAGSSCSSTSCSSSRSHSSRTRSSTTPPWTGFLEFVALYVPLWWAWVGFAFYAARFDFDDPLYRVLVLLAMLGTAAMAVNIGGAFGDTSERFALSYISVRSVLVVLYVLARARVPPHAS